MGRWLVRVTLDVFGDVQFDRSMLRIRDRSEDMGPAFNDLADDFLLIEREQFDTEGGFASDGWKQLAAATVEYKAQAGLDPRILHATLAMRKSLTQRSHKDHVRKISRDEMFVGTKVKTEKGYPYPRAHQRGKGVPRRRPVELRDVDRRVWVKALQTFVMTGETQIRQRV